MFAAVTGATGHVGSNLVPTLLGRGDVVRAVALTPGTDPRVDWRIGDVRDAAGMRDALEGVDVVFHLAAVISVAGDRDGLVRSVNVDGVRTVAEAARAVGARRFVHCSSVHAFDLAAMRGHVVDEMSPPSTDLDLPAYDRSKAAGERALLDVVDSGLDAVILNPTGIIGPIDPGPSRMGAVLRAAAVGRLPASVEGGFDWVDVRDVVTALIAAVDRGATGERYLVGGHYASISELTELACRAAGRRPPRFTVPAWLARVFSPAATLVARRTADPLLYTDEALHALESRPTVDHSKASAVLGHRPRPLDRTVRDLIASFRPNEVLHAG